MSNLVRVSKPTKLRLIQLKKITGHSQRKLIDMAVLGNMPFIKLKKIKNDKK